MSSRQWINYLWKLVRWYGKEIWSKSLQCRLWQRFGELSDLRQDTECVSLPIKVHCSGCVCTCTHIHVSLPCPHAHQRGREREWALPYLWQLSAPLGLCHSYHTLNSGSPFQWHHHALSFLTCREWKIQSLSRVLVLLSPIEFSESGWK